MVLVGVVKMVKVWQKIQNVKRYTASPKFLSGLTLFIFMKFIATNLK